MPDLQAVTVFCTVRAEVPLLFKPSETVGSALGNPSLEEVYVEHVLYKTFHSNRFYKKVFVLPYMASKTW